jgi:hypothetical protein
MYIETLKVRIEFVLRPLIVSHCDLKKCTYTVAVGNSIPSTKSTCTVNLRTYVGLNNSPGAGRLVTTTQQPSEFSAFRVAPIFATKKSIDNGVSAVLLELEDNDDEEGGAITADVFALDAAPVAAVVASVPASTPVDTTAVVASLRTAIAFPTISYIFGRYALTPRKGESGTSKLSMIIKSYFLPGQPRV